MSDDYIDVPYRSEEPSDPNNDAAFRLWSDGTNVNGEQNGSGLSFDLLWVDLTPQDVRNISSPVEGRYADHDGSGSNTEGLARYDGSSWISQVDGTTIS